MPHLKTEIDTNAELGEPIMQLTGNELLMLAQAYYSEGEEYVIDAEIDRWQYFDEHRWSEALQPVWMIQDLLGKNVVDVALWAEGEHYHRRSRDAVALLRGIWLGAAGRRGSRGC